MGAALSPANKPIPKNLREEGKRTRLKEATQAKILASEQKARFQRTKPRTLFDTVFGIDRAIESEVSHTSVIAPAKKIRTEDPFKVYFPGEQIKKAPGL